MQYTALSIPKSETPEKVQLSLFQPKLPAGKPVRHTTVVPLTSVLVPHLPEASVSGIMDLLREYPIQVKPVKHRTSKSGDFRAPLKNQPARITVNANLNSYAFLITLVHELAHHLVWLDHSLTLHKFLFRRKPRPMPHGKEWKIKFRSLMSSFLTNEVFPEVVLSALRQYLENPKASSSADHQLSRVLKTYDLPDTTVRLEELPYDAVFSLHGKRFFRKKEQLRKRFRCICQQTNRVYLISPNAPVERV